MGCEIDKQTQCTLLPNKGFVLAWLRLLITRPNNGSAGEYQGAGIKSFPEIKNLIKGFDHLNQICKMVTGASVRLCHESKLNFILYFVKHEPQI